MMAFISYLIYSGLILIGLYLIYKLLLAKETFHGFNRAYLLLSYVVAFGTLPVIFTVRSFEKTALQMQSGIQVVGVGTLALSPDSYSFPDWAARTIIVIYIIGVAVMLAVLFRTLWKISLLAKNGKQVRVDGTEVIVLSQKASQTADVQQYAPFSWGGKIFVTENNLEEKAVIAHEKRHLQGMHWLDLLFAQIIITFSWFNPAAWLIRRELQDVHEFEADRAVAVSGADMHQYQMMLIEKASGLKFSALANCLNHSTLTRRVNMMLRKPSRAKNLWKAALAIPMFAVIVSFTSFDSIAWAITPHHFDVATNIPGLPNGGTEILYQNTETDSITNGISIKETMVIKTTLDELKIYINDELLPKGFNLNSIDKNDIESITVKKETAPGEIYIYTKKK